MSRDTRTAIVDAHPMFRIGIAHILVQAGGCDVVAEGAGVEEACQIARGYAPDLMVLDLHSDLTGESVRKIAAECPTMRILVLTVLADEALVIAALQAGAAAYVLKGASGSELVESVRRVLRGESYVYPSLAARLLQAPRVPAKPDRFSGLTAREEQILGQLTKGLSNKEIGRQLNISDKTVKHYITALFDKLQVRNRLEAALLATGRS